MSLFEVLLTLHIVAAMLWVGGGLAGMYVGGSIFRTKDIGAMGTYCRAFGRISAPMFGGSALVVLGTGIWMVLDSSIEFSEGWISLGFAGWLASIVLGSTLVGRSWARLGEALDADGATWNDATQPFFYARLWTSIDVSIRIAVVALMVARPT